MKYLFLLIISLLLTIASILSLPTSIHRTTKSSSCLPNVCIIESAFCFCGFEKSPNDPCCDYKCSVCPANLTFPWMTFEIGPLNFFPLGPMNLT